jgi:hypothetical protein
MEKSKFKYNRNQNQQDQQSFFTNTYYFPTQSNAKTLNIHKTQYDTKNLNTYDILNTDPGIRNFGNDDNFKKELIYSQTKFNINKLKELNKKEQLKKHKQHFKLFKKDHLENKTETNFYSQGISRNNNEFVGVGALDMKNIDNFNNINFQKYQNIKNVKNSTVSPISSPLMIKNKNFNLTFKENSNSKIFNKTFQEGFFKNDKNITEDQSQKTYNLINLNKNSTGEKFYTSRTNFNKTNYTSQTSRSNGTNFSNQIQKPPKLSEDDKNDIISIYHFTKHGAADSKHQNRVVLSRDEKKEIMNKFEIKPVRTEKEEEILEIFLETNHSEKTEWLRTWNKFNRTEYTANPYFFKDPYKSLKKLKQNGQIFEKLMNEQIGKQIEVYSKEYIDEMNEKALINKMPKIRELKKSRTNLSNLIKTLPENLQTNKNQVINLLSNEKGDGMTNLVNLQSLQGVSTGHNLEKFTGVVNQENSLQQNILATKKISREQLLEKVDLYANYESFSTKNKPNARNQFSVTLIENTLYLFGGINSERLSDMWICNLKDFKWRCISLDEDDAPVPRAGHSAILYKKDIYIYGGNTPREYFKPREEILIFNTSMNKFYSEKPNNKNDIYWRRNHIAVRVGTSMFVHGGIDENNKFLSDFIVYDLIRSYWIKLECKGEKPPAIAYHSADLVCEWDPSTNVNFNIYKAPENKGIVKKIRIEGIYIFGGVDEQNNFSNELRILKTGKRPCEWINPKLSGKPPIGRINASLNFYQQLKILIIHGGRNDKDYRAVLNDIVILDLINFTWIRPDINPSLLDRTEHCSFISKDTLIILGGNNGKHFNNFEFCTISLDLASNYELNRLGINKINSRNKEIEKKDSQKFNKSILQNITNHKTSQFNNLQILPSDTINNASKSKTENFIAGSILKIGLGNKNPLKFNIKSVTQNDKITNDEKELNKSIRSNNSNNNSQSKITESREETQNSQRFSKRESALGSAGRKPILKISNN